MTDDDQEHEPGSDLDYQKITEMLRRAEENGIERRKKRDWVTIVPVFLSIAALVMVVAAWFLIDFAAPPKNYGWLSLFDYYAPAGIPWQRRPVNIAYLLLIVSTGLCIVAFVFNRLRMKRKNDVYRVSIFVIGLITVVTLVAFLVRFIPMGIIGRWR